MTQRTLDQRPGAFAAFIPSEARVAAVLEAGVDVNATLGGTEFERIVSSMIPNDTARSAKGWTVLHIAALRGDARLVRQLLKARADPTAKTVNTSAGGASLAGKTALDFAKAIESSDAVDKRLKADCVAMLGLAVTLPPWAAL